MSFAILPLLFKETKTAKWYWLGYAVLVALSRVVLQQHYLSDVVGGALLGYGIGVLYLTRKHK